MLEWRQWNENQFVLFSLSKLIPRAIVKMEAVLPTWTALKQSIIQTQTHSRDTIRVVVGTPKYELLNLILNQKTELLNLGLQLLCRYSIFWTPLRYGQQAEKGIKINILEA